MVWGPTPLGMVLAKAVDSLLTYTTGATGGSGNWGIDGASHAGVNGSAKSGSTGDGQQSWLQTTVVGAGTLSFWWKVSSEGRCDCLECWVDGVRRDLTSGEEDLGAKDLHAHRRHPLAAHTRGVVAVRRPIVSRGARHSSQR